MSATPKDVENDQYDHIVDAYSTLYPPNGTAPADFPLAAVETHQMYLALTDPAINIRGKRVLDLACGGGYYASNLLAWGAASVTGMDVSTGMLEAARQSAETRGIDGSRLKFLHGDATNQHLTISGAPFDIVTGCWLLNYAPDAATMTKMLKFIARNLRPGGYWVGLIPPPLLSDKPYEMEMLDAACETGGAWGRHGQIGRVLKAMPNGDGYHIRVVLGTEAHKEKAVFDCYSLSLRVFEQACKDSGVFEGFDMRDFVVPGHVKDAYPTGHWNDLALRPSCTVITARRVS